MTKAAGLGVSPTPYRRNPNSLVQWMNRAQADSTLLGRVERLLEADAELLASMVRAAPDEYAGLMRQLAAMVERHVAIVDAATEAHEAVQAASEAANNR